MEEKDNDEESAEITNIDQDLISLAQPNKNVWVTTTVGVKRNSFSLIDEFEPPEEL